MRRAPQRETNPYPFSDSNKRYQTYDYYLRRLFGGKCAKISLDAGFSCPNIDGTVSRGGCIFCKNGSSGAEPGETLREQYRRGKEVMTRKWRCERFIPYLQAHTNTYAPIDVLQKVYREAASLEGAVMLDIATRADCLSDEVLTLLREVSETIPVTVELGLQSTNDETAERINRGHTFAGFLEGYGKLRSLCGNISIGIHLINGLPGETHEEMVKSASDVASLRPDSVKLHLLHVIEGTRLARDFLSGSYVPMELHEYVSVVCDQLEVLPPECAIGRVTGDAKIGELLAPKWSARKTAVANEIDKELYRRQTYQGIYFKQ
ncbi:MAG: TIGR01212 family radical SAM protein [Clostridia bacterium]|nr:TIGR01212 family radical SAM protein [Clostridia bacterium]